MGASDQVDVLYGGKRQTLCLFKEACVRLDSRLRGNDGWVPACAGTTAGFPLARERRLGSCLRRNDGELFFSHLLETRHEPAQGIGHQAARKADVDQLEAGFILEGAGQGGVQL